MAEEHGQVKSIVQQAIASFREGMNEEDRVEMEKIDLSYMTGKGPGTITGMPVPPPSVHSFHEAE
jgi:hypothetical protein